ncbi:MAG: UvrB/UvrC motif-containing protein [Isosphaeraceae bacterium]
MIQDIRPILAGWDYEPEQIQVRIISGDDGSEKLQMRIDLGLIQMEVDGRPDGEQPEGFESLLELYEARARQSLAIGERFTLKPDDCARLMREGLQYYHRYVSAFQIERYDLVARDTARNLRLFSFVAKHAARQRDRMEFEQYRPYVELMRTRARANQALRQEDYSTALACIDEGIEAIRRFLAEYKEEEREAECPELRFLQQWRREVDGGRPVGPLERLEEQLQVSVTLEDFEEAARIRDQIRRLRAGDPREPRKLGSS